MNARRAAFLADSGACAIGGLFVVALVVLVAVRGLPAALARDQARAAASGR